MTEPKTYTIRTITDLLDVPGDRLSCCLADLEVWASLMRTARALGPEMIKQLDVEGSCGPDRFVWIDDEKHEARVTLHVLPSAGPLEPDQGPETE